jgi:hypothetical protein
VSTVTAPPTPSPSPVVVYVDPRGPRFSAGITTVILAIVVVTGSGWLLAAQTVVFGVATFAGLRYAPYGYIYRAFVRPRLPKPTQLEHPAPLRFAQAVGFVFAGIGAIGFLAGIPGLGMTAAAIALAAAFLNSVFNYCVGCETYLLFRRSTQRWKQVG